MDTAVDQPPPRMTVRKAHQGERAHFLAKHFNLGPTEAVLAESAIFDVMRRICATYTGGMWSFYQASNGAAFMVLDGEAPLTLAVWGNNFTGSMSREAASIAATIMGLSELSFRWPHNETLSEQFYLLRDYAAQHAESASIFGAID